MAAPVTYTLKEVSNHQGKESCWIVIDGKVYDVTKYLDQHPGGAQVIFDEAGSNATEAFEGHSTDAREILEKLMIGYLHPEEIKLLAKKQDSPTRRSKIAISAAVAVPSVLAVALIAVMIIYLKKK